MKKACKLCHERIKSKANICRNCGSFQDWRRHFIYGNSTLALVVALISVFSMGAPLIIEMIKPDNSELTIAFINRTDVMVPIVASNKGTRLAVMASSAGMRIEVQDKNKTHKSYVFLLRSMADAQGLIANRDTLAVPEGVSKLFYYQMASDDYTIKSLKELANENLTVDDINRCEFIVSYINFDGTQGKKTIAIFDRAEINKLKEEDERKLKGLDGAMDCLIKIPQPLLDQFKVFLG